MSDYFFIDAAGQRQGPVSETILRDKVRRGELKPQTPVWSAGWANWRIYSAAFPGDSTATRASAVAYPRWSLAAGGGLLVLALIALAVAGGFARDSLNTLATGGSESEPPNRTFLYLVAGLGLLGFAISLGVLIGRKLRPAFAVTALVVNVLALALLVVGQVLVIGTGIRESVEEQPTSVAVEPIEIAPILVSDTRARSDAFLLAQRRWQERNVLGGWHRQGATNAPWQALAREFLELSIERRFGGLGNDRWDRLNSLYRQLERAGCNDPRVLLAGSDLVADRLQIPAQLQRVRLELAKEPESAALGFICGKLLASARRTVKMDPGSIQEADDYTLKQLAAALTAGAYQTNEWAVLSFHLASVGEDGLVDREGQRLLKVLAAADGVPEWFIERWRGAHELRLAWKARGDGFVDTVTESGWTKFNEHSEKAREHLERAWKADPTLPFAAAQLCEVMLGIGDYPEMREWFDRSVAADFEYSSAYHHVLWGLQPRWHGSHEAMVEFGRACLNTGRFDTDVPWNLHKAVWEVIGETKDYYPLHQDRRMFEDLVHLYDGYEKRFTNDLVVRRTHQSRKLAAAITGGHWDEAQQFLKVVGQHPVPEAYLKFGYQPFDAAVLAISRGQTKTHPLAEAARLRKRGDYTAARSKLTEARAADMDSDGLAAPWIASLDDLIRLEEVLATGEAVSLTAAAAPHLWDEWPHDLAFPSNNVIRVPAQMEKRTLFTRLLTGDAVELAGEYVVDRPERDYEVVFHFGNYFRSDERYLSIRLRHARNDRVEVAPNWREPFFSQSVNLLATNRFRLSIVRDQVKLELNGEAVVNRPALPEPVRNPDRYSLGLSVGSAPDHPEIVFRELNLRRILAKRPTP